MRKNLDTTLFSFLGLIKILMPPKKRTNAKNDITFFAYLNSKGLTLVET